MTQIQFLSLGNLHIPRIMMMLLGRWEERCLVEQTLREKFKEKRDVWGCSDCSDVAPKTGVLGGRRGDADLVCTQPVHLSSVHEKMLSYKLTLERICSNHKKRCPNNVFTCMNNNLVCELWAFTLKVQCQHSSNSHYLHAILLLSFSKTFSEISAVLSCVLIVSNVTRPSSKTCLITWYSTSRCANETWLRQIYSW
jgi:hypothetical protein